jgi:hypothetical protein
MPYQKPMLSNNEICIILLLIHSIYAEGHESKLAAEVPLEMVRGVLSPSHPLHRQSILPDETVYYSFKDLLPSFTYEIKLSYPATVRKIVFCCLHSTMVASILIKNYVQMPANFFMDLVTAENRDHNGGLRKLLNTEKLIFTTPDDSALFCRKTVLRIRVYSEAVPWDRTKPLERILFNISIGGNFVGIPLECIPHVVWVAMLLLLSPLLVRFILLRIRAANEFEYISKQKH